MRAGATDHDRPSHIVLLLDRLNYGGVAAVGEISPGGIPGPCVICSVVQRIVGCELWGEGQGILVVALIRQRVGSYGTVYGCRLVKTAVLVGLIAVWSAGKAGEAKLDRRSRCGIRGEGLEVCRQYPATPTLGT